MTFINININIFIVYFIKAFNNYRKALMIESQLYQSTLLIFILVSIGTSIYYLIHKRDRSLYSGIFLLILAIWMICDYSEFIVSSIFLKMLFKKIGFIGVSSIPVLGFLSFLQMTNKRKYINLRNIGLISFIPALVLILAFTNEFHSLVWKSFNIYKVGPYELINQEYNVFFWIFLVYTFFILILGLVLIIRATAKNRLYYQWHRILPTISIIVPVLLFTFEFFKIEPFNHISFVHISIVIVVILSSFVLDSERKDRILSAAASNVIESMKDGVIILNRHNKILSFNPSAKKMFDIEDKDIIGKDIVKLFPDMENNETLNGNKSMTGKEIIINNRRIRLHYNLSISLLKDFKDKIVGKYILARDITDKIRSDEEAIYLGFHDSLTGLHNKSYFEMKIKEIDTANNLPLSIVIGGVNGLKTINEAFGYKKGDSLLCSFAKIFKKIVRKESIVTRWAGDEFALIFPKTSQREAGKILDRIREATENEKDGGIPLRLALGCSTKNCPSENIREVFVEAENNMFKRKLIEKESVSSSIIASLESTLFEKSHETGIHTKRLNELARKLGREIGLNESILNDLSLLSSLHDIGKIAITEEILLKKSKLTDEEWSFIKKHPEIGSKIAKSTTQIAHIADGILYHHEWWNGNGYPKGLKKNKIPIESRIISIVDAYDVMRNGRPYKKKMSKTEAVNELLRCSGTQFDPKLVEVFIKKVVNGRPTAAKQKIAAELL